MCHRYKSRARVFPMVAARLPSPSRVMPPVARLLVAVAGLALLCPWQPASAQTTTTVSFAATHLQVEEGGSVRVTVRSQGASPATYTFSLAAGSGGTATGGSDYTAGPWSVTLNSGATEGYVDIAVAADTIIEGLETLQISLPDPMPAGTRVGTIEILEVIILDVNQVPGDWALKPTIMDGGDKFRLLYLTRGIAATSDAVGTYNTTARDELNVTGAHDALEDIYHTTFRAVVSTDQNSVHAVHNTGTLHDPNGTGAELGLPIYWLDRRKVADNYRDFYDGTWNTTVIVLNHGGSEASAWKAWTGTYHGGMPGSLTPGYASNNPIGSDTPTQWRGLAGGAFRTVGHGSEARSNSRRLIAMSQVFQVDPDYVRPPHTVSLSVPASADEGDSGHADKAIWVELSVPNPGPSTFNTEYCASPGSDTGSTRGPTADWYLYEGGFALHSECGSAPLAVGDSVLSANDLRIYGDTVDEPDGTITLTLSSFTSQQVNQGWIFGTRTATYTIRDDDPTVVTLARVPGGPDALAEGGAERAEFTVALGRELIAGERIDVPVRFSGTGIGASDFTLSRKSGASLNTGVRLSGAGLMRTVTFEGSGARTATLEVGAAADGTFEGGAETLTVALGADAEFDASSLGTNVGGGADPDTAAHSFSVRIDETRVRFGRAAYRATEGDAVTVALHVNPPRATATAVGLIYADGTAGSGDYAAAPASVTIPANAGSHTFEIQTTEDAADEPDETFTVSIGAVVGIGTGSPSSATVTIADDDDPLLIEFTSVTPSPVPEGDDATVTVTLRNPDGTEATHASALDIPLYAFVTDDPADGSLDILAPSSVTIPANTGSAAFTVKTRHDDDDTGETVRIEFGRGNGRGLPEAISAVVAGKSRIEFTIEDSGTPSPHKPSVTVAADVVEITEGGTVVFTITADKLPRLRPVKVSYALFVKGDWGIPGLTDGLKYDETTFVTFDTGGSLTRTVSVATAGDNVAEADGQIMLVLTHGEGYRLDGGTETTRAAVTVRDDDSPPPPTPSVRVTLGGGAGQSARISENYNGEGNNLLIGFLIRPTPAVTSSIAVNFTLGGTATLGADYRITVDGTEYASRDALPSSATISPHGPPYAHILLEIVNDVIDDPDETIVLTVTAGTGYTLDPDSTLRTAEWIIENHDPGVGTPEVSIAAGPDVTEGEDAVFTLTASPAPSSALEVEVEVAESGGYAAAGTRLVTIPTGGTAELRIATTDDNVDEPDGSVTVTLGDGDGYTVSSSQNSATVAVADDDDAATWEPKQEIVDAVKRMIHNHRPKSAGGTGNKAAWGRGYRILGGIMGEDQTATYPGGTAETFRAYTSKECRDTAAKYGVTGTWRPWCDEIARREAWAGSASADRAGVPAAPVLDAVAGALALLEGVTPERASAALYDGRVLDDARLDALDRLGNANGSYDLGDLLAWIARCRRGGARCGGTGTSTDGPSGPAAGLAPLGGLAIRRRERNRRRRTPTPERTGRRATRRPRLLVLALALAAVVWGCDAAAPGGPTEPAALTGPGLVELRIEVPAGARAAGAMLVVEGPGIDSVEPSAPGLELVHVGGTPDRREVIVAGELATGTLLRIGVPDLGNAARYRVTVVQVADADYELMDPADYEVWIAR